MQNTTAVIPLRIILFYVDNIARALFSLKF